jgi:predicted dehydrogenase
MQIVKSVVKKMRKVAFAGCGRISDLHILGYENYSKAAVVGLFDVDREKAETKAAAWGVEKVYSSYEELLADDDLDVVEILTPHHLHCDMTVQAAKAGKHISLQKPMAMTIEEGQKMIDASREAGISFRIFENFVYLPAYKKAKELIDSGAIGEPRMVSIRLRSGSGRGAWDVPMESWQWRLNPDTCGGCLIMFDHGYHLYSVAVNLVGGVEKVTAWMEALELSPGSGLMVNSLSTVMWKYRDKPAYGTMDMVLSPGLMIETAHYADENRIEVTGTEGILFINGSTGRIQNRPPLELYKDGVTTCYEDLPVGWDNSFVLATRDFIEALDKQEQAALSPQRGLEVLEFALAVRDSAANRQTVELTLPHAE